MGLIQNKLCYAANTTLQHNTETPNQVPMYVSTFSTYIFPDHAIAVHVLLVPCIRICDPCITYTATI